ncbi:MAG: AraC family transcriptional regulator [Opitutus sp.]
MLVDLKLAPSYDGFLYLAESVRNPPTLKAHHHVELELNLVVRGAISYVVGGQRFTFERRTLLWLFPAQEHQLIDRTPDAQAYVAVFKPSFIGRSCRSELYADLRRKTTDTDGVLHTTLSLEMFDLVRRTMDGLMVGAPDPDVLNREAGYGSNGAFRYEHRDPDGLNAGLHHLLLLCWREQRMSGEQGSAVPLHPSVRKALDLLSVSDETLNLGQLARRCGTSAEHLSRLFGLQVGVSMVQYRNSVRLGRFLELQRRHADRTMSENVFAAGFGSYAQFHRVFARAYGSGPRESLRMA